MGRHKLSNNNGCARCLLAAAAGKSYISGVADAGESHRLGNTRLE